MPTLMELIGSAAAMTKLITRTPSGLPLLVPAAFMTPTKKNIGPTIPLWIEEGSRGSARVIHYGGPPQAVNKKGFITTSVTALHTSEFQVFNNLDLQCLTAPDGTPLNDLGRQEIARQTKHFKQRNMNLRYAAAQMALCRGALYFDGLGNILASSAGAKFTVDYAIPAGHQNQLDVFGTGAIIDVKWPTATANIPLHVRKIRAAARKRGGLPIQYALYGDQIISDLLANNYVAKMLVLGAPVTTSLANGVIPPGFLGIPEWIPMGEAFYEDKDGVLQQVCADDKIIFTPAVDTSWWDFVECSYIIPNQLNALGTDAAALIASLSQVFGMFSYAKLLDEPVCLKQIAGDTFLPMLNNNLAIFIADVDF